MTPLTEQALDPGPTLLPNLGAMQPLPHLRADEADAIWPDRDRVLASPDAPPPDPNLATCLGGPPGLAFGAALGLALAERLLAARFGRSLVDHRTWLTAGPAELAAGTSHEAVDHDAVAKSRLRAETRL